MRVLEKRKHHYFLAVKLPSEIKSFLHQWIEDRREDYPFLKWVHHEDYHLTLVFFGVIDEGKKEQLIEKVKAISENTPSFPLTFHQLGIFGVMKHPRIFWAGIQESKELNNLQSALFKACLDMDFDLKEGPFNPHITIARKWGEKEPFEEEKLMDIKDAGGKNISFSVTEIVLYETHSDEVPKYKEFAVFPLK